MTLGTSQMVVYLSRNTDIDLINMMLIAARGIVDDELAVEGLTAPATSTTLSLAVELLASSLVAIGPGAVNPRTGFVVDGFSRKDGDKSQIDEYEDRGMARIATYIAVNKTTSPIPGMAVVGRRGRRIGEYEEMTEEQEDEY